MGCKRTFFHSVRNERALKMSNSTTRGYPSISQRPKWIYERAWTTVMASTHRTHPDAAVAHAADGAVECLDGRNGMHSRCT